MRSTMLAAALLLLCGCGGADGNKLANVADLNFAGDTQGSVNGGGNAAPNAPVNEQAPAPQPPESPSPSGEPADEVTLAAAPSSVSGNGTVKLTLANGSSGRIGYNLCTSAVETAGGTNVPTGRVCTMELRTLQPGRTASFDFELRGDFAAGRYRFSTGIERIPSGTKSVVRSNIVAIR